MSCCIIPLLRKVHSSISFTINLYYMQKEIIMKENPQYLRTDKAIRQALIVLLKTKPFEKITVQDILDETPVTRSTFY